MTEEQADTDLPPFLRWGNYKSGDENNPDILELKVLETETFETEYSVNVGILIKDGSEWIEVILPLKSHTSNNASLLKQWTINVKNGKLKAGKQFKLKTWLGTSKRTQRPIRRFVIEFG